MATKTRDEIVESMTEEFLKVKELGPDITIGGADWMVEREKVTTRRLMLHVFEKAIAPVMAELTNKVVCVFCDHEEPWKGGFKQMAEHIAVCRKHPMRQAVLEHAAMRMAIKFIGLELRGLVEHKDYTDEQRSDIYGDMMLAITDMEKLITSPVKDKPEKPSPSA